MVTNDILVAYEKLAEKTEQMCGLIKQAPYSAAQTHDLPRLKSGEPHGPISENFDVFYGERAITHACKIYSSFFTSPELNTKSTWRSPGVIVIPNVQQELISAISDVNTLKAEFETLTLKIKDPLDRFYTVHKALPWLNMKQVRRKVHHLSNDQVRGVSYTWGRKKKTTKIELSIVLNRLLIEKETLASLTDNDFDRTQIIEDYELKRARAILEADANGMIKHDTVQIARPLVNCYHHSKPKLRITMRDAAMPIILINCGNPKIRELTPYQRN